MSFNKTEINKGLRYLAVSLPCMFLGPIVIYSAFSNKEHFLYIPVLIFGVAVCFFAAFIGFRGIKRIIAGLD